MHRYDRKLCESLIAPYVEHKASTKEAKEKIHKCLINDSRIMKTVCAYVESCDFNREEFETEVHQYILEKSFATHFMGGFRRKLE